MSISRGTKIVLSIFAFIAFGFIYVPLGVILINSFSTSKSLSWPPSGFTTEWWGKAIDNQGVRDALWTSVRAGLGAMTIAILLGFVVFLAFTSYDEARTGAESEARIVAQQVETVGVEQTVEVDVHHRGLSGAASTMQTGQHERR